MPAPAVDGTDEPRPSWACQLHRPPKPGQDWMKTDDGYTTCGGCLNNLRSTLRDIGDMYARLDARPGANGEHGGRGAPGFGSRPPATLTVVAMRDPRTLPYAIAKDDTVYVFDPNADHTLQPGQYGPPRGEYTERRDVWYGADGRPHQESDRGVLSVPATLAGIAAGIADMRDLTAPRRDVPALIRWLDNQLDWLTRQTWVAEPAGEIHRLAAQIRGVNNPRRKVGHCPNEVTDKRGVYECSAQLYAPLRGDSIACRACGRVWHRPEWEHLGRMIQEQRLAS